MIFSNDIVDQFIDFHRADGLKPLTLIRFRRDILRFFNYAWDHGVQDVEGISIPLIEDYKVSLVDTDVPVTSRYYWKREKLSDKTVEEKIQVIKNFLKWSVYRYGVWMDADLIHIHRAKSKRMDFFTKDEMEYIFRLVDSDDDYRINKLRFKLILLIGFTSGLRLFEILKLRVRDVMSGAYNIEGKWDKLRWVFFREPVKQLLQEYLEARGEPIPWLGNRVFREVTDEPYVIVSHHPTNFWMPCVKSTICRYFKKFSRMLPWDKELSCHTLRHSFATYLLRCGVNLSDIQQMMWHAKLSTTAIYLHNDWSQIWSVHENIFSKFSF